MKIYPQAILAKCNVLEISLGKFSETDEIRLEDKYKRRKKR